MSRGPLERGSLTGHIFWTVTKFRSFTIAVELRRLAETVFQ